MAFSRARNVLLFLVNNLVIDNKGVINAAYASAVCPTRFLIYVGLKRDCESIVGKSVFP